MNVGMCTFFQNLDRGHDDRDAYRHELEMADLAEPLGFDSLWAAEHHFDDYDMCPNTLQFLSYMAGRTRTAKLGQMVVVLPWHDPVRVAEELVVLDHMSGGRAILGLGRGLARAEFKGFRVEMSESRRRFDEYAAAILDGLETGFLESDGEYYVQPRVELRPRPLQSFRGRTYAAAVSPSSAPVVARLGLGQLIIAQKPWETTMQELADYRVLFREVNEGREAPRPIIACFTVVDEDEGRAQEMMERYIQRYCLSTVEHYEFADADLANVPGYEYYGALAANIEKHGADRFARFLAELQVWGTPDQVFERVRDYQRMTGCDTLIGAFSFGGIPHDDAKRSMRLFAEKVLPRLKALQV
jgi:alkanesulfonate monooxygenase SsuD/methylene tetrahydromethanopterin reductase-like flavin-dependent oxidoreductase (luciferase family)